MSTVQGRYRVEGMDCASCAAKITTAVRRVPGVGDVSVSISAGTMTVDYVGDADDGAVLRQGNGLGGYRASPLRGKAPTVDRLPADGGSHDHDHAHHDHGDHRDHAPSEAHDDDAPSDLPWWRSRKASLTLASGSALALAFVVSPTVAEQESTASCRHLRASCEQRLAPRSAIYVSSDPAMIYEHTAQKGHFVIEWAKPSAWGDGGEAKWVASCNGAFLAHGADPQTVLDALSLGLCLPTPDGSNPAGMALPPHLDGWRTSRDRPRPALWKRG